MSSSFTATCPECGATLRLLAKNHGRAVICPDCKVRFVAEAADVTSPPKQEAAPSRVPPEPWFYRFLLIITHVGLWANLAGVAIGLLIWLGSMVLALVAAGSVKDSATGAFGLAAIGTFTLPYLAGLVVWLIAALTAAGWSFLLLDAARNLRQLRYAIALRPAGPAGLLRPHS
jgi:lysine biosynthesis protein LysW